MDWMTNLPQRFPGLTAILLGFGSALGFAPFGQYWVMALTLVALFALVAKADMLRQWLKIGYGFGWGHFVVSCIWIPQTFTYQPVMPHWYGWPALAMLSAYLAIYPMAAITGAGWLVRTLPADRRALALVFALTGTWTICEILRAILFTGFAWNPLGVAMVDLASPAAWVGTYGLSALVMLTAGAIWLLSRRAWRPGLALAVPLVALWMAGHVAARDAAIAAKQSYRAQFSEKEVQPRVTIVQPNIGQDVDWQDPDLLARNRQTLLRLSQNTSGEQRLPRIIFWSESATTDTLEDGYPRYFAGKDEALLNRIAFAELLGPDDLLVTGGVKYVFDDQPPLNRPRLAAARNSVFAINASAQIIGSYDKAHLVPYGEYLPMKPLLELLGLAKIAQNTVPFIPGPGPDNIDLGPLGKAGILVCYEIIFSGETVNGKTRPDFLFNPSNDAWFGFYGPPQQLAQARLRAIEEGLPIIRTTPTGISAIIDANGYVRGALPWGKEGRLDGTLPFANPPTLFGRFGNLIPLGLSIICLLIAVAMRLRQR